MARLISLLTVTSVMIACAYGQYRQIGGKLTHITASVFNLVMNNLGQ